MFSFNDVIGQENIKAVLRQEVQDGRVPHAQLFCGTSGVGKLALALAYARYLCCPNRTAHDACGSCPSCVKWEKLIHPDMHFLFPIVKNAKGKKDSCDDYINEWRQLLLNSSYFEMKHWLNEINAENGQPIIYSQESDILTRKLSLKSSQGGYKICIVWRPELLHEACANKLLKLLEEPPAQTLFLLISETPEQILPTILSRTQRRQVPPLPEAEIAHSLQQRFGLPVEDSLSIGHRANGSYLNALEAIHLNEENELFFDLFVSLMRLSYQRKIREMKQWSEQLAGMGREKQKSFLQYAQRMIRENFIYNLRKPQMNYMTPAEQTFANRFSPFVNERNIFGITEELSEAQRHIEGNVNPRMVFFDFSLKMIVLLKQ